ncbi:hypothetical protein [Aureispira anguillae]|uniref:Lipoprotein n=1 Tax=Aureispira anguillae TaxID=2864201 RepID=A0A916DRB1_9BACT|nr:hypothetical protein [Aureispira anguillae]BDS11181.1 hypothetical protein AsAng_0018920 [Aureispira anguillae]
MKLFYLIGAFFLLVSCDPSVTYTKVIENNSDHDIWLINRDSTLSCVELRDSVLLSSHSIFELHIESDIGGSLRSYESCPLSVSEWICPIDTIDTRIDGIDSLNVAFTIEENSNWQYSITKPGQNGKCECRLVINQGDIN